MPTPEDLESVDEEHAKEFLKEMSGATGTYLEPFISQMSVEEKQCRIENAEKLFAKYISYMVSNHNISTLIYRYI